MTDPISDIRGYHQRTKHHFQHYARGPSSLDWDSQPDGFLRHEGARLLPLPLCHSAPTPPFVDLGRSAIPAQPLSVASLGLFLELGFGLSAWKAYGAQRWPLRNNPSSGNLHPTETWVILPEQTALPAGLYHYAPAEHGLEERARFDAAAAPRPQEGFWLAFSSLPWREAWKYGERAFRYCQHDVGHALGAACYAAACLGWSVRILTTPSDETLAAWLGLTRPEAGCPEEAHWPDVIAWVTLGATPSEDPPLPICPSLWFGQAQPLSPEHVAWPVIDAAESFSRRTAHDAARDHAMPTPSQPLIVPDGPALPAGTVIRQRRSAQRMQKGIGLSQATLQRMFAATLPSSDGPLWRGVPWAPSLALLLWCHQVEGLEPGLYLFPRAPDHVPRLQAAMDPDFLWQDCALGDLPLWRLAPGDLRSEAARLCCQQAIAGHGAVSLGMVADFSRTLEQAGDWAYRRLHWEAGMIGQALYLEATAAGLAGTGIGCFFDDGVHQRLGLRGMDWQTLYHFTIGAAVEDARLTTHPPYPGRMGEA